MKCPNCGAENKKTNSECKICKKPLQNIDKKDENFIDNNLKEELKKELKADLTIEIQDLKADIAKEIISENNLKPKKQKNIFSKIWLIFKLLFLLSFIGIISLVIYVYGFYDYEKYYKDAMNRYYETENDQYIDNIKLFFRVYKYNDNKIRKVQNIAADIVGEWIEEVSEKEFYKEEDKIESYNNLIKIIDDLYNKSDVKGHTAISKKDYTNLNQKLKELKMETEDEEESEENKETNNKKPAKEEESEENKETNNKKPAKEEEKEKNEEYDVSKMREIDIKKANNLFSFNKLSIIYIGRENCGACKTYVPTLNKVAEEKNLSIYYIDLEKISKQDYGYDDFEKNLSYKTSVVSETDEVEGTFGELLGYTPMTIIIKNKKQVDGAIGSIDYNTLLDLIEKYI